MVREPGEPGVLVGSTTTISCEPMGHGPASLFLECQQIDWKTHVDEKWSVATKMVAPIKQPRGLLNCSCSRLWVTHQSRGSPEAKEGTVTAIMTLWKCRGSHKWGSPKYWMFYFMENPSRNWWFGGTPMTSDPPTWTVRDHEISGCVVCRGCLCKNSNGKSTRNAESIGPIGNTLQ
jgi:hypothetical protein